MGCHCALMLRSKHSARRRNAGKHSAKGRRGKKKAAPKGGKESGKLRLPRQRSVGVDLV